MRSPLLTVSSPRRRFSVSPAAQNQNAVDRAVVEKIKREGLDNSKVYATFSHFVDVIGPRLTATPGKAAADWSRDQLTKWGLRDARLESWEFGRGWQLDHFTLEMTEPRYMPLIGYPEAGRLDERRGNGDSGLRRRQDARAARGNEGSSQGRNSPVPAVQTSFIRETGRSRPIPGTKPPRRTRQPRPLRPRSLARKQGARPGGGRGGQQQRNQILREAGPAVLLRTSRGEHGTMFVLGRDQGENAMPSVIVAGEHYNMIVRMLSAGIPVTLRVHVKSRYLDSDRNGYNVLAELPGSDPVLKDEIVMIGGHLDCYHSAPGATDNADGSAVVLEAMRILAAVGAKPRRTIRMALWGGEEEGLLGSRECVRRHLAGDANVAARDRFSVYFNIDPGTGPIYGWFLQGQDNVATIMDAWLEPFKDLGARKNVAQSIGSTDHLSFTAAGLPGFNPVQDYVDYDVRTHHTNVDTFERVREADLKQAAVILASFAYHAAMRTEKMPRPK
jgi:hypothetical protein